MSEIRNIFSNWKDLAQFQQTKLTLGKWQLLQSNLSQVEQLYSILGNFK